MTVRTALNATRAQSLPEVTKTAGLFAVVFGVYAIYLRVWGDPHFYYDAANYWSLAGTFGRAGHFSLLDFNSPIRGYSLPLFNRGLQVVASHLGLGSVTIVLLFGSLEIALLGVVLVPRLVRELWPQSRVTPTRILLFNGLVFFFWRDYMGFPLSDFPALTLAIVALLALSRRSIAGYAVAGLAAGFAWNVRPAYSITLVLIVVLAVSRAGIRRTPLRAISALALVLAGIFIAVFPQMLINHRHTHSWSPSGPQIVAVQLTLGMQYQRRESYVGPPPQSPAVLYTDPQTQGLLNEDHLVAVMSVRQYERIVVRHPIEMIAGWTRHIFDGLDVRYSTVYIHDLNAASWRFSLFNYTLIFAALARLLAPSLRRQIGKVAWPEVVVLSCACIPAIPFAVESRFFLPIQLIVYSLVVFGTSPHLAWSALGRAEKATLGVLFPMFLLVCITLSTSSIAQLAPS